jgi:hypothetical protein
MFNHLWLTDSPTERCLAQQQDGASPFDDVMVGRVEVMVGRVELDFLARLREIVSTWQARIDSAMPRTTPTQEGAATHPILSARHPGT